MHPEVAKHIPAIQALCREFGVERMETFGSAVTDDFDPETSDVDLLVTYPDGYDFGLWLGRFFDLESALASILKRDVDLIMHDAPKNPGSSGRATEPGAKSTMRPNTCTLLEDMLARCERISRYVRDMTLAEYLEDVLVQDAVERNFIALGEMVGRISREEPAILEYISASSGILGLRHRIAHGYDAALGAGARGRACRHAVGGRMSTAMTDRRHGR
jgi:uncharacterized protein with HEPN domain/predicted nucleotidyltransferase